MTKKQTETGENLTDVSSNAAVDLAPIELNLQKKPQPRWATAFPQILVKVSVAFAIIWLAGKDWLTSSVQPYPYADAFAVSAAVLFAVGAVSIRNLRVDIWRTLIVGVGAILCLAWIFRGPLWPLFWEYMTLPAGSVMPSTAVMVLIFGIPLAIAKPAQSKVPPKRVGFLRSGFHWAALIVALVALVDPLNSTQPAAQSVTPTSLSKITAKLSRLAHLNGVASPNSDGLSHHDTMIIPLKNGRKFALYTGDMPSNGGFQANPIFIRLESIMHSNLLLLGVAAIGLSLLFGTMIRLTTQMSHPNSRLRIASVSVVAVIAAAIFWFSWIGAYPSTGRVLPLPLIGVGLTGAANDYDIGFQLVGEQGVISYLLIVLLLSGTVFISLTALSGAAILSSDVHPDKNEEQRREALFVSAAALSILAIVPECIAQRIDIGHSWLVPISWLVSASTASLVISARCLAGPVEDEHVARALSVPKPGGRSLALTTTLFLLVLVSLWLISAGWLSHIVAASARSVRNSSDTVMTAAIFQAGSGELPIKATWTEVHNTIRVACGASIASPASMATEVIGHQAVRQAGYFTALDGPIERSVGGLILSHDLPDARILELFISDYNFGVPMTPHDSTQISGQSRAIRTAAANLSDAAEYFFHKPISALSEAEVRFLICDDLAGNQSNPMSAGPGLQPDFNSVQGDAKYVYEQVDQPAASSANHIGAMNENGEIVGGILRGALTGAFTWNGPTSKGRIGMRGGPYYLVGINDRGDLVGSDNGEAILMDGLGHIEYLGTLPGFEWSAATGINNENQVVGYAYGTDGSEEQTGLAAPARAFLWQNGKMHDLGVLPGHVSSRACAVNDSGQICGWMLDNRGHTRAMVWDSGKMQDIGAFAGGQISLATSINNAGQVVGAAQHGDGTVTAFMWQDGTMHDLGRLNGDSKARAYKINDFGQIVGASFTGDINNFAQSRAFLWDSKHGMRDLTQMLATTDAERQKLEYRTAAYAINNHGQVTGVYNPGPRYVFFMTPARVSKDY